MWAKALSSEWNTLPRGDTILSPARPAGTRFVDTTREVFWGSSKANRHPGSGKPSADGTVRSLNSMGMEMHVFRRQHPRCRASFETQT
mmetsp:Transcript_29839/g.62334  ORF Transcript_29839/g.62334 Transcript_29839/m.62334 type:complete len:88 (-) Transcript_29839:433-696(-)